MMRINGKEVPFVKGQSVLDAATSADIYIPTLCNHPHLPAFGACRMCLVRIDGMRGFNPACTTPTSDNMVVQTETTELQTLRRSILALTLSEHPNSCVVCKDKALCAKYNVCTTKAGRVTGCNLCPAKETCELRKVADYLKIDDVGYELDYHFYPLERKDPFYDRDYNLCILCGRCVRVCEDIRGVSAIAFIKRGHATRIGTAFGMSHLDGGCQFCGACVDVCPTGALSPRGMRWSGKPDSTIKSTCTLCGAACGIELQGHWGKLVEVEPDMDAVNQGQACVLGRFCLPPLFNSKKRAKYPLVLKEGSLVPVDWEEAVSAAAEGLRGSRPEEIAFVLTPDMTNESALAFSKLSSMLPGSKVVLDSPFDMLAMSMWSKLTKGEMRSDLSSIDKAEGIILIGADVCLTHPVLQVRIKKARDAGAYVLAVCEGLAANERLIDLHVETRDHKGVLLALMHGLGIDGGVPGEFPDLKGAVDRLKGRKLAVLVGDKVMEDDPISVLEAAWKLCKCSGNDGGFIPLLYGNSRGIFETLTRTGVVPSQSYFDAKVVVTSSGRTSVLDDVKFLLLFDAFESKLMKRCSVFLPCAGLPEDEGTMTSLDGRHCGIRPIADPLAMAKQDWEVLSLLRMTLEGKGSGAIARDVLGALSKELEALPKATVNVTTVPMTVLKEKGKRSRQFYRGADIAELVDDLKVLYKYRGVIE